MSAAIAGYVTAILAVVGTIGGALITALWADRRQREQLKNERKMRQREESAEILDGAAEQLVKARRGVERVHILWRGDADPLSKKARDLVEALPEAVEGVRYARDRLAIRFGEDSELFAAYMEALTGVDDYRHAVAGFSTGQGYSDAVDTVFRRRRGQLEHAQSAFLAKARVALDPDVPPPSSRETQDYNKGPSTMG